MNALQSIQVTLERMARRRRMARLLHGMWCGLFAGALLWLVAVGVYKVVPLPLATLGWAALAALLCPVAGAVWGGWRRPSLVETARWLDVRRDLKERLSTALEVAAASADGWRELVVEDAARHAQGLDARRLVPFHLPPAARWSVLVLALGAGLGFMPEYRSPKIQQKQADVAGIRHVGAQLIELTRRELQRRPPVLPATEKALESVTDLGEKFQKASLTRSDALRDLANVSERLKEQLKDLRSDPALRKLEQAARAPGGGDAPSGVNLQQQIEQLQRDLGRAGTNSTALADLQRKLEQLQHAAQNLANQSGEAADAGAKELSTRLSALAGQAAKLGVELPQLDAALAALAAHNTGLFLKELDQALTDLERLRDLAKRLEALQALADKLGKDLAEQLELGQVRAAANTLRKMVDQLQSAGVTLEQMQRLLGELGRALPHAGDYGKVADLLQRALQQGQQGDRTGMAQALAAAADELEKLLQQLGDAEALLAALDNLDRASACIGQGKGWGLSVCQRPGFRPGSRPGPGVGTWGQEGGEWMPSGDWTGRSDPTGMERPDLDPRGITERESRDLSDVLKPDKVRGRFSPGDSMPSITLKGVSIKGASRVQYEEAVAAAQAEAQSALSQEKVPRAYQGAVKDYFDDLKK